MAEKKSFILYLDYKMHFDLLTNEQKGILINALFEFAENGEVQKFEDKVVEMAFSFISIQMKRDKEKYDEVCERRREAGKLGGRPKKPNGLDEKAKKPNGFLEKQTKAKKPDTDNDTDNDTDIDKEKLPKESAIERDFEECWKIYPKKQGKQKAFSAYKKSAKASKNPDFKEIVIKGIQNYINYINANKTQDQFIKQGSTYFCNECWNDEYNDTTKGIETCGKINKGIILD